MLLEQAIQADYSDIGRAAQLYLTQTAWFVDSVNGKDTNNGLTSATAIRSLVELSRRWEGRVFNPSIGSVTVTLAGSFATEVLAWLGVRNDIPITVQAAATLQGSGVVSAFTALAAPATDAKLTDATTPTNWAAHVGRRIRLTSGADAGSYAWVLKDLGGNQARVSQFINPTTLAAVSPGIGVTFAIETLDVPIGGLNCFSSGTGTVTIKNVGIATLASTTNLMFAAGGNPTAFVIEGARLHTNSFLTSFSDSAFRMVACSNASQIFTGKGSVANFLGHAAFATINCQQGGDVRFANVASCFQAARISIALAGYVDTSAIIAIFDLTGAGTSCIGIDTSSSMDIFATIMGINNTNTGPGVQIRSGGKLTWSSAGVIPTITATGGDLIIGGAAATTWAAVAAAPQSSVQNANNGAMAGLRS
jgi:hypothetical protein